MRYPHNITKGDLIGICAPSSGVYGPFIERIEGAINALIEAGFDVVESPSVRRNVKAVSNKSNIRAEEFLKLYFDDKVNFIIPPWGGQFLMDMLPFIDFERIKMSKPKWIQGFSDTSGLLFAITTLSDMATSHGPNLTDFGARPVHKSVWDSIRFLSDTSDFIQNNMDVYQKDWGNVNENSFVPYNLTEKVIWKSLSGEEQHKFYGRLIGGCMDVICKLIGTNFDKVELFSNKYKDDGFIWYFESCEMSSADIYRTLWQMKMNGWFEYCKGFLFGRPDGYSEVDDFNMIDSLQGALGNFDVPVIYNADIGHLPPQLTIINGALAEVEFNNGCGRIMQRKRA